MYRLFIILSKRLSLLYSSDFQDSLLEFLKSNVYRLNRKLQGQLVLLYMIEYSYLHVASLMTALTVMLFVGACIYEAIFRVFFCSVSLLEFML